LTADYVLTGSDVDYFLYNNGADVKWVKPKDLRGKISGPQIKDLGEGLQKRYCRVTTDDGDVTVQTINLIDGGVEDKTLSLIVHKAPAKDAATRKKHGEGPKAAQKKRKQEQKEMDNIDCSSLDSDDIPLLSPINEAFDQIKRLKRNIPNILQDMTETQRLILQTELDSLMATHATSLARPDVDLAVVFETTLDLLFSAWETKKTSVVAAVATKFSVPSGNVQVLSARTGSTIVEFKLIVTNVAAAMQVVTTMQQEASVGALSLGGIAATAVSLTSTRLRSGRSTTSADVEVLSTTSAQGLPAYRTTSSLKKPPTPIDIQDMLTTLQELAEKWLEDNIDIEDAEAASHGFLIHEVLPLLGMREEDATNMTNDDAMELLRKALLIIQNQNCSSSVLAVLNSAARLETLNLNEEERTLQDCIRPPMDLQVKRDISYKDFCRLLTQENFDIIHLAGHGDVGTIHFADKEIVLNALLERVAILCEYDGGKLQILVINTCYGAAQDKDFEHLQRLGVAVVAVPDVISDPKAIAYSEGFYEIIGRSSCTRDVQLRVKRAHDEGMNRIKALRLDEDKSPVHGADPRLYYMEEAFEPWKYDTAIRKRQCAAQAAQHQQYRPPQELRDYQREVVDSAMQHNSIIFMPTGAGKTICGAELAKRFFEYAPQQQILFIVETIPLVYQQAAALANDTGLLIGKFCGEVSSYSWTSEFNPERHNIIVITSGLLINLLDQKELSLQQISLMIFDEAHHCTKNHPMNMIMKNHYFTIAKDKPSPHVVGLTASPGSELTIGKTQRKVYTLCLNMNCTISTPLVCQDQLQQHVHRPPTRLIRVSNGENELQLLRLFDGFLDSLRKVLFELDFSPTKQKLITESWMKTIMNKQPSECADKYSSALTHAILVTTEPQHGFILDLMSHSIKAYVSLRDQGPHAGIAAIMSTLTKLKVSWEYHTAGVR